MHFTYLNVKFCVNVSYVSHSPYIFVTDSCSHNTVSVLHTYIVLFSDANTLLVLLVFKCAAFLKTRRHREIKYP